MRIVKASASLEDITTEPELRIERVARTCYQSEGKIAPGSAAKLIAKMLRLGHHSMFEHASASVRFVCDRGISHEIVRHRLASYAQESTRFCMYSGGITVIEPPGLTCEKLRAPWVEGVMGDERAYLQLLALGKPAQSARANLPTCLKTEIVMTTNLREGRHVFNLRLAKNAHPQIQSLMLDAFGLIAGHAPTVFADIAAQVSSASAPKQEASQ